MGNTKHCIKGPLSSYNPNTLPNNGKSTQVKIKKFTCIWDLFKDLTLVKWFMPFLFLLFYINIKPVKQMCTFSKKFNFSILLLYCGAAVLRIH